MANRRVFHCYFKVGDFLISAFLQKPSHRTLNIKYLYRLQFPFSFLFSLMLCLSITIINSFYAGEDEVLLIASSQDQNQIWYCRPEALSLFMNLAITTSYNAFTETTLIFRVLIQYKQDLDKYSDCIFLLVSLFLRRISLSQSYCKWFKSVINS